MASIVTTNLRFPAGTYEELRLQAGRRRVSVASIVREAVAQYLGRGDTPRSLAFGGDPLDALAGSIGGGPSDESVEHDHYLYGWTREDGRARGLTATG